MYNVLCMNIYTHSPYVYSVPTKAKAQGKVLWESLGGVTQKSSSQGTWRGMVISSHSLFQKFLPLFMTWWLK